MIQIHENEKKVEKLYSEGDKTLLQQLIGAASEICSHRLTGCDIRDIVAQQLVRHQSYACVFDWCNRDTLVIEATLV